MRHGLPARRVVLVAANRGGPDVPRPYAHSVFPIVPLSFGAVVVAAALGVAAVGGGCMPTGPGTTTSPAPLVSVDGNRLVDGAGRTRAARGREPLGHRVRRARRVGASSTVRRIPRRSRPWRHGVSTRFGFPSTSTAGWASTASPAAFSGTVYQDAIVTYVDRLSDAGMIVVLDLHWSAPGDALALGEADMPDADHAPAFWRSVATTFANRVNVVFDLFNEPRNVTWGCWRDGCTTNGGWVAVGMQQLVDVVRDAGARNPIVATGLGWGNDLSGWLADRPTDPAGQLVAGFHVYNFSGCVTTGCWDGLVAPVAALVPVVTGEVGEDDCARGFVDSYFDWAEPHAVSTVAWAWDAWAGCSGPPLITAYDGTPTAYGAGVRARYLAR